MNTNLNKMKKITLLFAMAVAFMSCAAQNYEQIKTNLPVGTIGVVGANGLMTTIPLSTLASQLLPFLNLQSGVQGPAGPGGPIGLTGAKGDKGDIGLAGSQGIQGLAGANGAQGIQGVPGTNGTNGKDGVLGLPTLGNGQAWVMVNGVVTAVDANFLIPIPQFINQTVSLTVPPIQLIRGGNYEVSGATVSTGSGSVSVKYTYTDAVSGNVQTVTPPPNTLTVINAQAGTMINFSTAVIGTVNYSFSPFIYTR